MRRRPADVPDVSNIEMGRPIKEAMWLVLDLASLTDLIDRTSREPRRYRRLREIAVACSLQLRTAARLAPKWGASYGAGAGFKGGEKMVRFLLWSIRDARRVFVRFFTAVKRGDEQTAIRLALRCVTHVNYVRGSERETLDDLCEARDKAFKSRQAKREADKARRAEKRAEKGEVQ